MVVTAAVVVIVQKSLEALRGENCRTIYEICLVFPFNQIRSRLNWACGNTVMKLAANSHFELVAQCPYNNNRRNGSSDC